MNMLTYCCRSTWLGVRVRVRARVRVRVRVRARARGSGAQHRGGGDVRGLLEVCARELGEEALLGVGLGLGIRV